MIGLGANPELRDQNAELAAMGTIVECHWRNGNARTSADIAAHERETNPVYDPNSNPVSILRQGSSYVVADAGGNTVVGASKQGATSTIAVLPGLTANAPPFLGLPTGTQIPVQVNPGGTPEVVAGGLFAPYGLALSGDSAYVPTGSVLAGGGQVVRIPVP